MTVKTNINLKHLIISVLIPLAVGGISSLIVGSGFDVYAESVAKPPLSPPAWLFPVVWTVLYILMGISSYLVYERDTSEAKQPLALYAIQLAMNFMWPIFFFSLNAYLFSFIWLILLWALVITMTVMFYRVSRLAGLLQIPYILWLTFAAYLNLSVYLIDRFGNSVAIYNDFFSSFVLACSEQRRESITRRMENLVRTGSSGIARD